jgi:hypothetical protein
MNSPLAPIPASTDEAIIASVQSWLESMVIGLNLCPFAKGIYVKKQIRYVVSQAETSRTLMLNLERELQILSEANPLEIESTLLIHPFALLEFQDFNSFLPLGDLALEALNLTGVLQIASFHPDYQFQGVEPHSASNFSNRSPHPILHLLREETVSKAVDSLADPDEIFERNIETLNAMGFESLDSMLTLAKQTGSHRPA